MLRAFGLRSSQLGTRAVKDVGHKLAPAWGSSSPRLSAPRTIVSTNASSAAPEATTQPPRRPSVPLYRGQQTSEAVSIAEGHLAGPGEFNLVIRNEPQAANAMRVLQNVALSQKQAGKMMEVRWVSLRRKPEEQQQQQQLPRGYFNFRHLLVCSAAAPRTTPEKEIRVPSQAQHREIALRAYDVLKEEAIKPAALPTVSLLSIGAASHLVTFKAIHTLRVMLRNIRRGLVVQLDEHKAPSKNEDGSEVMGLRYNIFLEELPEGNRPSDNGNQ